MHRKYFLKTIFGASILISMDRFSSINNSISDTNKTNNTSIRFASFGAIHLNNTSLEKSTFFWTKIAGMKLRSSSEKIAEFGTETKTLVVVYETAKYPFKKGYSGLYHVAIHAPNNKAFANMINRLMVQNYPFSPVDHTMSKSVYLDDPDGINIEFTLETPERFKRVVTNGGLRIEDVDGNVKSASDYLNINEVLEYLEDNNSAKIIDEDTYIGHLHLYANNVENSNTFYTKIGFIPFNNFPQFMYSDLGFGGAYQHRIALNSWHGINRPLAPKEQAGMRYFHINFNSKEKLEQAVKNVSEYEKKDDGYFVYDTTGNSIFLSNS
ncbi:VOC family protein [Polaribacter haliotis]|uniref:VOC family protein n=1 Tax=Polaribacter haliotis TaxID=1888915 RepID=A0A7L8AJI7_9FLAO|nr:VOC family protein [Polaribacter haliotis]QOD62160.1 VOC family protein [Polaribacter haliotis]